MPEPKIIIDEDWKSQVEAEKEAANQEHAPTDPNDALPQADAPDADLPMPPASFSMLVSSLATEAMMALGQLPHPVTGEVEPRRHQAKYLIDTIEMLREKTIGNVAAEESAGVEELLHQLRMAFVQMPATTEKDAAE
ncbi:MAG: DUF1844 domain-containing protein [Aeoliella sp.]